MLQPPWPPYQIQDARGINERGQISATGIDLRNNEKHALILNPILPGDLDADGDIDTDDLLELLTSWGPCSECDECLADVDGDCVVGISDLLVLLGNWGP